MKVHHITPARSDLNFGEAINDLIKGLPNEDWVCLRDIDTIPPLHKEFIWQCEEIAKTTKLDLISCMTNRIGLRHQLYNGVFSDDHNLLNHKSIALELFNKAPLEVIETKQTIAGVMMLFSVNTWRKVKGFPTGAIKIGGVFVDYLFCKKVLRVGMKIGIAKNVYLYHAYRMGEVNPRKQKKHLTTKIN